MVSRKNPHAGHGIARGSQLREHSDFARSSARNPPGLLACGNARPEYSRRPARTTAKACGFFAHAGRLPRAPASLAPVVPTTRGCTTPAAPVVVCAAPTLFRARPDARHGCRAKALRRTVVLLGGDRMWPGITSSPLRNHHDPFAFEDSLVLVDDLDQATGASTGYVTASFPHFNCFLRHSQNPGEGRLR